MSINSESAKSQLLKRLLKQPVSRNSSQHHASEQGKDEHTWNEIPKVTESEYYPVSFSQKRMYLLHQMNPSSVNYNLPLAIQVEGRIDTEKFQNAVNKLVDRHESLRTGIKMVNNNIVQYIEEKVDLTVEKYTLKEEKLPELMRKFSKPFDISIPSLARIALVELENCTILLFDIHHIVADGISLQVILRDLMLLYNGETLAPLNLRYRDFASWQDNWFESESAKKQEEFWLKQFEDEIPILDLPTDFPRPEIPLVSGSHVDFSFSEEVSSSLKKISKIIGITEYTLLLGIYSIILSKYSGQKDIVIGSPVAGRRFPEMQEMVGMFVNTIAIRSSPISKKKVSEYLLELRNTVHNAIDAQDYPFEALVEKTGAARKINRNPIFDVMFSMQNMNKTSLEADALSIKAYPFEREVANFDLELYMTEENGKMQFRLEYNSSLFLLETIEQFVKHYKFITKQLITNPNMEISELHLLDNVEQLESLRRHRGNDAIDDNCVFTEVFESHVRKTPNSVAAICNNRTISYSKLNSWSNKIANSLLTAGINNEELVVLWLDRDIEFLASMLGVFKTTGAYVPIDPALPEERIQIIIEESKSLIILTESKYKSTVSKLVSADTKVFIIEELLEKNISDENPGKLISPENLAYVIFTSGSTGRPKGVMVEQQGMLNHIRSKVIDLELKHTDRIAETATQSFDVSVWQFLTSLYVGGTTVIFKGESAWQPKLLITEVQKHNVTVLETVPSHLIILMDEIEENYNINYNLPLRWMMLNGETLLTELCRRWFKFYPSIPIVNAYGPTECSDDVSHYVLSSDASLSRSSVPISGTIPGMSLYVLDEDLNQLPKGIVGELYVGGIGVGRGYLSNPAKTASSFIPDLYSIIPGKRMYKTGDLVRELSDGTIEFLGRRDFQVKINGMRIEVSEIEQTLLSTGMVHETVVIADRWDDTKGKQLCAYVVLKPMVELNELKSEIKSMLPNFMIPTLWVCLESFPLLINGKVDRKSLPKPNLDIMDVSEYIAPITVEQHTLAELWADVLNIEKSKIGLGQEFFQLGGTSLKAMRLVSKIKSQLDIDIPFTAIFSTPKFQDFVKMFEQVKTSKKFEIHPDKKYTSKMLALPEHQHIFRQTKQMADSVVFNMPYQSVIEGELDIERAEKAFRDVCERHWMMSVSFIENELGELFLQKNTNAEVEFTKIVCTEEQISEEWKKFVRPFKLDSPLFRMKVLKVNNLKYYLFFDNHTLAADFASKQIILKDFMNFYLNQQVKPLKSSYLDYIDNRMLRATSSQASEQELLWRRDFSNFRSRLQSIDADRLEDLNPETAKRLVINIEDSLLVKIKRISAANGVSEHSTVLSAFSLALFEHFKQNEFFILSPVTDREVSNFVDVVGLIFDNIPVPQQINVHDSFIEHLIRSHQSTINAYSKRDYPAISLYDSLASLDKGWNEGFFDATFVWVEPSKINYEETGLSVKEIINEKPMARFDLRLEAFRNDSDLKLILEYRERLFLPSSIHKIMQLIISAIESMATDITGNISKWREMNL